MSDGQIVIARTPEVSLEDLERICLLLEKNNVVGAPLIFPIEYPLDAFDWDKSVYDSFVLLRFFRWKVGFDELPLIVLVTEKSGLDKGVFCDVETKTCLMVGFVDDFSWVKEIL